MVNSAHLTKDFMINISCESQLIELFSIAGRKIKNLQNLNDLESKFDEIPEGIYILKINKISTLIIEV